MATANIKNIDSEKYKKTLFILKTKGKNFTQAVKEMCDEYADEFDRVYKK